MLTPTFIAPRRGGDSGRYFEATMVAERRLLMCDLFDLPDLYAMDDGIANGTFEYARELQRPSP